MALALPTIPSSIAPNSTSNVKRSTVGYHPSLWADHFQSHAYETKTVDASTHQDFERLKGEVRKMIMDVKCKPSQKLRLIDEIQRLGVGYHFESEIENALSEQISHESNEEEDLYIVALRFRLLRQQGIKVSCDTFEKFKDGSGNFKASLIGDLRGLLSLYEAAFLGIRGENILDEALAFSRKHLDEALAFSRKHLEAKLEHLSPDFAQQVTRSLNRPIWKCLKRIEARHYLTVYSQDESHNKTLLKFAKLDYNIVQGLHQKELCGITEWWKRLDVNRKLPYARDRVVECFFWITGVYFEPQYSLARRILTRIIAMASVLDDTYDNYATVEELELLTEAIQRWDMNAVDVLPEYMKTIYCVLIDLYAEIEDEVAKEGRSFAISYAKEAMKAVARSYFAEAKWRDKGYVPTMDEYLEVSLVSGCYKMLSTSSFLGMRKIADKEAFEYISHDPKIVIASSVICRLMDDIVSSEFEQQREHVASAIQCYTKQHRVSEEEVVKVFREEVTNAWKDINEECLKPTAIPLCLLERVLNLARVIDFLYKDGDCYTNSYLVKDVVALTLKDPVT